MGEIIKRLAKGKLLKNNIEIELNHPPASGQDEQIHIQSAKFRFEMDKADYLKFAAGILVATENLKRSKRID